MQFGMEWTTFARRHSGPMAPKCERDRAGCCARRHLFTPPDPGCQKSFRSDAIRNGVDYFREAALGPDGAEVRTRSGRVLRASTFVYASGPWLPKIFPEILERRIRPTRQEVFFFGTEPGDRRFTSPNMPAWLDFTDQRGAYALPDIENRGFKLAFDRHGPPFDPDTSDRLADGLDAARAFLAERFPAVAGAPLG